MIQQIGLFPHQTVGENIATVPHLLGWDRGADRARVCTSCSSWSGWIRTMRGPLPGAALGRAAPAGGRRPRARGRPAADADGRAVRGDRPDHRGCACRTSSCGCRGRFGRRSSSSPTTSTRRSRWATGSRSSARAGVLAQYDTPRRDPLPTRPTTSSRSSSAPTAPSSGSALTTLAQIAAGEPRRNAAKRAQRVAAGERPRRALAAAGATAVGR